MSVRHTHDKLTPHCPVELQCLKNTSFNKRVGRLGEWCPSRGTFIVLIDSYERELGTRQQTIRAITEEQFVALSSPQQQKETHDYMFRQRALSAP